MQSRLIIRTLCVLLLAAPCAAHAGLLGIRPGAWKDTVTTTVTIPGQSADKPQTLTKYECQKASVSTKSYLQSLEKVPGCKLNVLHHTARMVDLALRCGKSDADGFREYIHIRMQALSATHAVSSFSKSLPDGKIVHVKRDSRWVSATCTKE